MTNITTSGYVPRVPTLNNPNRVSTGTRSVSSESTSVKDERTEEAFAALRSLFQQNESDPEIKKLAALQIFFLQEFKNTNGRNLSRRSLRKTIASL